MPSYFQCVEDVRGCFVTMVATSLLCFDNMQVHEFSCCYSQSDKSYSALSFDVAVFQWITSCNIKCYDHMHINTFAGKRNVIDDVRNNNVNFH